MMMLILWFLLGLPIGFWFYVFVFSGICYLFARRKTA
jgi:hypothetical protein